MKRAIRVVAVLGAAMVAACFTKPDAPNANRDASVEIDSRGPADAMADGAQTGCSIARDDFELQPGPGCGTWAMATNSANVSKTRTVGVLQISILGSIEGGCATANPFHIVNGTSIEVVSADTNQVYVRLAFQDAENAQITMYKLGVNMYQPHLECSGHDTTAPTVVLLPAFFRLRAAPAAAGMVTVTAEKSTTNGAWQVYDSCTFPETSADLVNVGFGGSGSSTTQSVELDEFNTYMCPPPP